MGSEYIKTHFHIETDPVARQEAIIQGDKFRITLLTSQLIRFEYDEGGVFEDRATQTILFRNLEVPEYTSKNTDGWLEIETAHLVVKYKEEEKYALTSLEIFIKDTGVTWKYSDPNISNLKGTYRTLDNESGPVLLNEGLLSREGWSVLDDHESLVFDANSLLVARDEYQLDFYFFGYGNQYIKCIQDYYTISGKTPLIPRYMLGNWWSRYHEYDEKELKELILDFEQYQIPLSVCIIDMDWHLVDIDEKYGSGWTGYTWNRDLFPDPVQMLEWLRERDLKISLNLHPALGIRAHEEIYPEFADFMGLDKESEKPIEFDMTDPKFIQAYFELIHHPYEDMGVDFWWIDWQQGLRSKIEGLDPLWLLNHYHFLDLGRRREQRPVIFSRWAERGNQRYPIGFSGDTWVTWDALKFQPYFTSTASNIGYGWWSHDIGGHMLGTEDSELYLRWVQFGLFSPILRLHSTKGEFYRREPWKHDPAVFELTRTAMQLRHQLVPYIYSMAYLNYSEGIPLIRPMYYQHPHDDEVYAYSNQYWFGSELLVSPIVDPVDEKTGKRFHRTYLPVGEYFNYFSKEHYQGGKIIERCYGLADIPVFVKAGGIVCEAGDPISNGTELPEKLIINIFPGASNTVMIYEDDGETQNYKDGIYNLLTVSLDWSNTPVLTLEYLGSFSGSHTDTREIEIKMQCIGIDEKPVVSGLNGEIEYIYSDSGLNIRLALKKGSEIKFEFKETEIVMNNLIQDQAYELLDRSKISTVSKFFLKKKYFEDQEFTSDQLSSLYRSILLIDENAQLA